MTPSRRGSDGSPHIVDVKVMNLKADYPPGEELRCAGEMATGRLTSLVLVTASNGAVGSVWSHPTLTQSIVEHHLGPMILGEDPREIDSLWQRMYNLTRWYGRKGVAMSALGGIDIALWDLVGKIEDVTVRELLGARTSSVDAYASGLLWKDDVGELRVEARQHLSDGFTRMKMRLGRGPSYDVAALEAVVGELGPSQSLIVDGSQRYDSETAAWLSGLLAESGVVFFEEPFAPEDIDSYVELSRVAQLPIAAGENEFGVQGFRELLRAGAVSVVQPDVSRCGGITEGLRIGRLAEEFGAPVAPHSWSDAITIVANANLVAALPNGLSIEIDTTGNPLVDDLVDHPVTVTQGRFRLSDRPGLGFELNEETVAGHLLPAGEVPDGHYSDIVFGRDHLVITAPYGD